VAVDSDDLAERFGHDEGQSGPAERVEQPGPAAHPRDGARGLGDPHDADAGGDDYQVLFAGVDRHVADDLDARQDDRSDGFRRVLAETVPAAV
jgi:hypothetical protein